MADTKKLRIVFIFIFAGLFILFKHTTNLLSVTFGFNNDSNNNNNNIDNDEFVINTANLCHNANIKFFPTTKFSSSSSSSSSSFSAIIAVPSAAHHQKHRAAIRCTWGNKTRLLGFNFYKIVCPSVGPLSVRLKPSKKTDRTLFKTQ